MSLNLPMISTNSKEKSPLFSICEIRPYLYICSYCSITESGIRQLGITHAVDATNIPKTFFTSGVEYLAVPVDDSELGQLKRYFQPVAEHVRKARSSGGKALVYCAAGVSRSAALCMTTLMIVEGVTLQDAYAEVLAARPIIAPNLGFWRQMIEFEAETRGGKTTVELLKGMRRPIPSVYLHRSSILRGHANTGGI